MLCSVTVPLQLRVDRHRFNRAAKMWEPE